MPNNDEPVCWKKKKQTKENIDKARLVLARIHHVENFITFEQAPDEVSRRARNWRIRRAKRSRRDRGVRTRRESIRRLIISRILKKLMRQSIPAVSIAPPPPPGQLPGISIFFEKKMGKFPGVGISCLNAPGWGRRKRPDARPPKSSPSNTSAVFFLIGEFVLFRNQLQSHLATKKSGGFTKIYYNMIKLRWDCGGCPPATRDDRRLYSHGAFCVKNQDI